MHRGDLITSSEICVIRQQEYGNEVVIYLLNAGNVTKIKIYILSNLFFDSMRKKPYGRNKEHFLKECSPLVKMKKNRTSGQY